MDLKLQKIFDKSLSELTQEDKDYIKNLEPLRYKERCYAAQEAKWVTGHLESVKFLIAGKQLAHIGRWNRDDELKGLLYCQTLTMEWWQPGSVIHAKKAVEDQLRLELVF